MDEGLKEGLVSIITINYNQNQYTLDCIGSLLKSDYKPFNIILIDNGSSPENFVRLKQYLPDDNRLRLVRIENNTGYVGGINTGLKEALEKNKPDYFLIMNNDTLIESSAIRFLVHASKQYGQRSIVTGKVMDYYQKDRIQTTGTVVTDLKNLTGYFAGQGEEDRGQYDVICERDIIDDIFWLIPKGVIDDIGLYSNWFYFGYEQAEYALRAKRQGYKLVYTYMAKLYHKGNASVNPNTNTLFKTYWGTFGFLVFRYLFQKKRWFLRTYGKTLVVIFSQMLIAVFNKNSRSKFGYVKLLALHRFHIWWLRRIPYNQSVPRRIKKASR
jgi:GT2 family glycosyltransferase